MAARGRRIGAHCRDRVGMAVSRAQRGRQDRGADRRCDRADGGIVGEIVDRQPGLALPGDELADRLGLGFGPGEAQIAAAAIAGLGIELGVETAPALDGGPGQRQFRRVAPGLPDAAQRPA